MKRILLLCSLLISVILSGCGIITRSEPTILPMPPVIIETTAPAPTEQETPAVAVPPGLTEALLKNSQFLSPQFKVPVTLVNGKFAGDINGSSATVVISSDIQFGDLNQDSVNDAALLLAEDTGGSGVFLSLVVIYSQNGGFKQAPGIFIDDRPIINSFTITDGKVEMNAIIHGPADAMVSPTLNVNEEFSLVGNTFFRSYFTSGLAGSSQHLIVIDSPKNGESGSGSIRLAGSMPIGPFENNLSLRFLDQTGVELSRTGFMVQASDMGQPATFDKMVPLPALPSGSFVILELCELSMADGSPIAVTVVGITLK